MKDLFVIKLRLLLAFFLVGMALSSCGDKEIADAIYPEEILYMPAAVKGIYRIENIPQPLANVPTPGGPTQFRIAPEGGQFTIPLAVYRAGVKNSETIKVDIKTNFDTINSLINSGELAGSLLLPDDKYSVDSSVDLPGGKESVSFDLNIDLDYLINNPNKTFAIGLEISSPQRKTNPELRTTIVVVDTDFLIPSADFTFNVDPADWKTITFTNTSANSTASVWDFGDGTTSNENSPQHTFAGAGIFPVKLTVTGLTGKESVKTVKVPVYDTKDVVNVALNKPVRTSDNLNNNYTGNKAVDNIVSNASRWVTTTKGEHWIEIDLQQEYNLVSFKTLIGANGTFGFPIPDFMFQAEVNGEWENIVEVTNNSDPQYETSFPLVTTSKVRYYVPDYSNNQLRLYEIAVYALP